MKILFSAVMGEPSNPKTWSNAPANLIHGLESMGVSVETMDNSVLSNPVKAYFRAQAFLCGFPASSLEKFNSLRSYRGRRVAKLAKELEVDHIICAGRLDAPTDSNIPYSLWIDNTWDLHVRNLPKLMWTPSMIQAMGRQERLAFTKSRCILAFSEHVAHSVVDQYGVDSSRVDVVGCGSGSIRPFQEKKKISEGHLLFVAKHLFEEKGGALVLEAFELIKQQRPQTQLKMVVNKSKVDSLNKIDGVEAYGFLSRNELNDLFYGASMLVQPMLTDPWGQVYLEAMKARAVVVSFNRAALPELTDGGRLASLVASPTPTAIAEAVLTNYERNQNELDLLTLEAQKRVLEKYNWPLVSKRVYESLVRST